MPHAHSSSAASSGGDDLGSTDEVKVFKDEGDGEDEKRSSENLLEEKSSLIDWTESEEKSGEPYSGKLSVKSDLSPVFGKLEPHAAAGFNMGYLMAPYPYPNGGAHPLPVSMAGKMGLPAGGGLSLFCPGGDLGQPPPAHMGIPPPYQLDSKLAAGLARTPMYPFPGGAYPYPMLSPEMSQVAASWHTPSMYPISSAASGFRSPYPTTLPITSSSLTSLVTSELYRFSPTLGGGLGLGIGPALVPPPPSKSDLDSHQRYQRSLEKNSGSSSSDKQPESSNSNSKEQNKKPHIKKPLNAFMLYMKEMRAKVVAECTLKESAAINQILGRRWHSLSREEQAKYYEKARQERQLHMQLYPGWSARDNYGYGSKKKKRKKDRSPAELGGNNLKKCRARYGLDQQNQWCKPCRRKKKCVRYMEALAAVAGTLPLPMATPQSPCSDGDDVKLEDMSDASSDADTPLNSASSPGDITSNVDVTDRLIRTLQDDVDELIVNKSDLKQITYDTEESSSDSSAWREGNQINVKGFESQDFIKSELHSSDIDNDIISVKKEDLDVDEHRFQEESSSSENMETKQGIYKLNNSEELKVNYENIDLVSKSNEKSNINKDVLTLDINVNKDDGFSYTLKTNIATTSEEDSVKNIKVTCIKKSNVSTSQEDNAIVINMKKKNEVVNSSELIHIVKNLVENVLRNSSNDDSYTQAMDYNIINNTQANRAKEITINNRENSKGIKEICQLNSQNNAARNERIKTNVGQLTNFPEQLEKKETDLHCNDQLQDDDDDIIILNQDSDEKA